PQCSKKFHDKICIQAHLNSQSVLCHTHFEELVDILQVLQLGHNFSEPLSHACKPTAEGEVDHALASKSSAGYVDTGNDPMDVDEPTYHNPVFVDQHPSASRIYGKGCSFMDTFDMDEHADKQAEQPYYPFASKDEWELASILLQSNLSITAINNFLELQLVNLIFCS
ncbi:hypothetical protein L208DRAFT_1267967, partial [Tricholoma matsutake]